MTVENDIFAEILGDKKLSDDTSFEEAIDKTEDIFEMDEQEDTPAKSQTENTNEDEKETPSQQGDDSEDDSEEDDDAEKETDDNTVVEDKDTPFHKRWAKREEKIREDYDKKIADLENRFKPQATPPAEVTLPSWWTTLAGDDDVSKQAFEQYRAEDSQRRTEIKKELIEEQKNAEKQEKEESDKMNQWVDDEIGKLKDSGKKFNKNELIKIAVDYQPTDSQGNISLEKAFDIYQMQKQSKVDSTQTNKKKVIASDSASNGPDKKPGMMKNIRSTSWSNIND